MTATTILIIVALILIAPVVLPPLLKLLVLLLAGVGAVLYSLKEFLADCWWELRHGGEWD